MQAKLTQERAFLGGDVVRCECEIQGVSQRKSAVAAPVCLLSHWLTSCEWNGCGSAVSKPTMQ
eukprot:COSAG02_NODE_23904_length_704_cov_1.310744_1_plen_63_part_00